jgi:AhpD family alkylhydroperoxidase
MTDYQTRGDLQLIPALLALAPTEGQTFMAFHTAAAEGKDGAIPRKYRELIALGVAFATQCSYCIDAHTRHAREHGATREELAEAAFVAAAVKAGGTLAHSLLALRLYDGAEPG